MATAQEREPLSNSNLWKYSSYGAMNVLAMATLQYQTLFNTNVLMLTPTSLATILLVARIIDFFVTFMVGSIIENAKFKSGKYIPWLGVPRYFIYAGVVLTFFPLEIPFFVRSLVIIVAYLLTNTLLSFVSTTQYAVLAFLAGPSLEDRNKLVLTGYRVTTIVQVFSSLTTVRVRNWLLGILEPRNAYITMAAVYGSLYLISIGILQSLAKQYDGPHMRTGAATQTNQIKVADMIKAIGANDQLLIYLLSAVFAFIGMMSPMSISVYYYLYIQNDPTLVMQANVMLISTLWNLVSSTFGPRVGTSLGRKKARIAGTGVACVAQLLIAFFGHTSIYAFIAFTCLNGFAMSLYTGFSASYIIDVGNYGYWKTKVDNRTVTNSLVNIPMKISTFIGGSIGLYGLDMIGFSPNMEVTTEFTRKYMLLLGGLPAVCFAITAIMTALLYKIDDAEAKLYLDENIAYDKAKAEAAV